MSRARPDANPPPSALRGPAFEAEVERLTREGATVGEISAATGRSRSSIKRRRIRIAATVGWLREGRSGCSTALCDVSHARLYLKKLIA